MDEKSEDSDHCSSFTLLSKCGIYWESSDAVVVCLTQDQGAEGSSLISITVLCLVARHINPTLVLVQPRKTLPYITEKLLMGCKESNKQKMHKKLYSQ